MNAGFYFALNIFLWEQFDKINALLSHKIKNRTFYSDIVKIPESEEKDKPNAYHFRNGSNSKLAIYKNIRKIEKKIWSFSFLPLRKQKRFT